MESSSCPRSVCSVIWNSQSCTHNTKDQQGSCLAQTCEDPGFITEQIAAGVVFTSPALPDARAVSGQGRHEGACPKGTQSSSAISSRGGLCHSPGRSPLFCAPCAGTAGHQVRTQSIWTVSHIHCHVCRAQSAQQAVGIQHASEWVT